MSARPRSRHRRSSLAAPVRRLRVRSTSLLCHALSYSGGARVTAWQRAGAEDVSPAAQPSPSLLIGGTRAPLTGEIDKSFVPRALLFWRGTGDRVAKSRGRGCQPGRAAVTVAPHWRHPCAAYG